MTLTSTYLFKIPGNPAIQISQEQLRSLLGEIEAELHRSKVYRQAMAAMQNLLDSSEAAKNLFKAVGREAIGLAFQQFAHYAKIEDNNQQINTKLDENNNVTNNTNNFFSINSQKEPTDIPSQSSVTEDLANPTVSNTEDLASINPVTALMNWLNPHQKTVNSELNKQTAAEHRLEVMRQIGQQLRQVREARGFSYRDLSMFTHLPSHQMEAVENANLDILAEDVLVRGFIRVMGNALGLNGTILANSLPRTNTVPSVLPSWSEPKHHTKGLGLEIQPVHLYVGYTALIAGTVAGLSFMSQPEKIKTTLNPEVTPSSSISQSTQNIKITNKPGIKTSATGISVGSDIAPPEAL